MSDSGTALLLFAVEALALPVGLVGAWNLFKGLLS